ncbi:hypothetical protein HPB49_011324 [Dermacentor silvarum]|uniref:Uncharacterized protein n=1 Tax=Dermacentor silvarum TaxID=543639 RepID=A0ACB8D532_DERSI|nr:hypothetical protein HPB49_011324 [Dermacentor silvarum]
MSSEEDSSLDIEIEALKAIYIHELEVSCDERQQSTCVKVSLHPATADNAEEQYVRLDLVLVIPPEYPDVLPEITIRNPRGLSDEKIAKIQADLQDTAQENVGSPMLYQLIEVVCPVCRLPLPPLLGLTEEEHPPPMEQQRQPAFCMTPELEQLQRSMAHLYVRQQRQGGIINVDAEKNKFLLEISAAPESSNVSETPKHFGAFKLRNWRQPARHTGNGASVKTSDTPFHSLTDRQEQQQHEPRFPKPSKNRQSRPTNRQQMRNERYDEPVTNGFVEHSGESSSSSGAERLQRSETGQRSRRSRPHHGRGRGGQQQQQQQQNWYRSPPVHKEAHGNARSPEDYRRDYDGSHESTICNDKNSSRETVRTTMRTFTDSSPSWNTHSDQDYRGDGHADVSPSSPASCGRYDDAPEAQSKHHGGQGHRRGRRGGGGGNDRSHHGSAQQAFRKKQLKSQGVAPRNHEPPGIYTPVENR